MSEKHSTEDVLYIGFAVSFDAHSKPFDWFYQAFFVVGEMLPTARAFTVDYSDAILFTNQKRKRSISEQKKKKNETEEESTRALGKTQPPKNLVSDPASSGRFPRYLEPWLKTARSHGTQEDSSIGGDSCQSPRPSDLTPFGQRNLQHVTSVKEVTALPKLAVTITTKVLAS